MAPRKTASAAADDDVRRLTFDLDVDICVVGAGVAGITTALEAARMGASVAVLEAQRVGWGASGHHLGSVMPGYELPLRQLVSRVGRRHAAELWRLTEKGVDLVRANAAPMPGVTNGDGVLMVSSVTRSQPRDDLDLLSDLTGMSVTAWSTDRIRDTLATDRYSEALEFWRAFQIDGGAYLRGLADRARHLGVRIFEETPVLGIDASGIRKRISTPLARMRASQIVIAGNAHLGPAMPRLASTILPVWRYAAVTEALDAAALSAIGFGGAIIDRDAGDHYRRVGDRLIWSNPETTWAANPKRVASPIRRRIASIYPDIGKAPIAETWSGAVGCTVHGMPQIGEIRPGLWVASGFGRKGLATATMAARIVSRAILWDDDRWKLFSPFDLVWAGGTVGRAVGHGLGIATRRGAALAGAMTRFQAKSERRRIEKSEKRNESNRRAMAQAQAKASANAAQSDPPSQESDKAPATLP